MYSALEFVGCAVDRYGNAVFFPRNEYLIWFIFGDKQDVEHEFKPDFLDPCHVTLAVDPVFSEIDWHFVNGGN